MDYIFHILIIVNIYLILSLATNLLVGYSNLVSLGQAGFYGIGAYITAFCLLKLHLSIFPALAVIVSINGIVSLFIAYSSIRLKGDFFTLATIGFQLIVYSFLYNWVSVTQGPYGISSIPAPRVAGGLAVSGAVAFWVLSSFLASITLILSWLFTHSPFGRMMRALREDEVALSSLGKNPARIKTVLFFISSGFIGLAAFIYTSYISFIDPTSFNLEESLFILSAVLIGGSGNLKGPVVGALFVVLLPELLRFIGIPSEWAASLKQIIYGLSIIVIMRIRPQGLAGSFKFES